MADDINHVDGCVCVDDSDATVCAEVNHDDGYQCTREAGHGGPHIACSSYKPYEDDPSGHRQSEWRSDAPDEPEGVNVAELLDQPGFRETLKTAADRRDDIEVTLR